MYCKQLPKEDLDRAFEIGGADNYTEYLELHQNYADLYVGSYHAGQLVGICCGWPFYQVRSDQPEMVLSVIAITPEHRGQGYGTQLIQYWEQQVAKRGRWLVSLGLCENGLLHDGVCHQGRQGDSQSRLSKHGIRDFLC